MSAQDPRIAQAVEKLLQDTHAGEVQWHDYTGNLRIPAAEKKAFTAKVIGHTVVLFRVLNAKDPNADNPRDKYRHPLVFFGPDNKKKFTIETPPDPLFDLYEHLRTYDPEVENFLDAYLGGK